MEGFYFISYSKVDSTDLARKLTDDLQGIPPPISVWLEERECQGGIDWDEQLVEALRTCSGVLFLMTADSVHPKSECKREWTRALRYKKPIIPLLMEPDVEMPYRLDPRQYIDFTGNYDQAMAALRTHLRWRLSPKGILSSLQERLYDAERDLPRAPDEKEQNRIKDEMDSLRKEIVAQQEIIANPEGAKQKTQDRVESSIERERQPIKPVQAQTSTKFINPPPTTAPTWFQNRFVETQFLGNFLQDSGLRMMTVVGRGGVGKTAMVCRLLKALENGHLPDDLGPLPVDGIVYLSPKGLRQVNFPHLYADLCRLLPPEIGEHLSEIYRTPQASADAKMQALLNAFPQGRVVVLLDNFEEVVEPETGNLQDQEFQEALQALLELPQHGVKVIITTRVSPKPLLLTQAARQELLRLDQGLASPHAENLLQQMDANGSLGLRDASSTLLDQARQRTLGYPRALEALVAILKVDRSRTLAELLDDAKQTLPDNVVEVLVGEAFSSLDPLSQQVMQALAILGNSVTAGAVDFLLQPYLPTIDSAPVLGRLVNMFFARRESGQFYLHPVDRSYALSRIPEGQPEDREVVFLPFTRFALLHRAADYYQTIRTSRENWKTIDDLAPHLAEIKVRIAGEDYDTAASVLLEIDSDYLLLWGHARLTAKIHERLVHRITDYDLELSCLNNLGNCYYNLSDYQQAIKNYQQTLEIAQEIGDRLGEGSALGNLGNCCSSLGNYPKAIDYQQQSLEIAQEIGDRLGEGSALGSLGNCCSSLGNYPKAIDYQQQSLEIAQEIGDRLGEGSSLGRLGDCYVNLGDYQQAIDYYQQSLEITCEIGYRRGKGGALFGLGNCYVNLGDYQQAIDYYQQYLEIAREIGDRLGEGNSLGNLGTCYSSLGDYPKAIDYQQQSLEIAQEIGDRLGEGSALGRLGNCCSSLGNYPKAIDYQQQSLEIAQEIGDRLGEGSALDRLGNCYYNLDDYSKAIDYQQQSLEIARKIGDRLGEGNSLCGLGNCYFSLGDYQLAIDYYQQYLAITREIGDRRGEGNSLCGLGNCCSSLGDYQLAIDYYQQYLAITREIGDRLGEGNSLCGLGHCCSSLGDYQLAIDYQQQSLAISREIGDRLGEGTSLGNLGHCCSSLGDYQLAIDYQQQSLAIAREIGDEYGESDALTCLGDVYTAIREFTQACENYQEAIEIAGKTSNRQNLHTAYFGHALANLLSNELGIAQDSIELTQNYDYPGNNAAALTLAGIIHLRTENANASKKTFLQGVEAADKLLKICNQNLWMLDIKALAHCGLALCGDISHLTIAHQAFQAARQITTAKGVITHLLQLFDALAMADTDNILATTRPIAAGQN